MAKRTNGIDFAALARRPKVGAGRKTLRRKLHGYRMVVKRLENQLARQEALATRYEEDRRASARSNRWRDRVGAVSLEKTLLARMRPGEWYARPDLKALMPEYTKDGLANPLLYKLVQPGLIDRVDNPDKAGPHAKAKAGEGLYLYRLSGMGEVARVKALAEIEAKAGG